MFKKSSQSKSEKPLADLVQPKPSKSTLSKLPPPSGARSPNTPRPTPSSIGNSAPAPSSPQSGTSSYMTNSNATLATPSNRTTPAYELHRTPAHTLGGSSTDKTSAPQLANLHVGKGLELKGEISSCDSLVIEGNVEAEIESGSLTVSETGQVKGDARVDEAEIEGLFEGTLEVKGCLIIRATGKVTGTVHYGQLMIDQGGRLIGEVDVNPEKDIKKSVAEKPDAKTDARTGTPKPVVAAAE